MVEITKGPQTQLNIKNISYTQSHTETQERNFHNWKFGTINIRTGKENEEGSKNYMIATEVDKANLAFCCMQEVRYRNAGMKKIRLKKWFKIHFYLEWEQEETRCGRWIFNQRPSENRNF